ncbi:MAG: hypothetical protein Q7T55_02155 [Solirubrobacteraceae bacterium]|nr:hypothetical protein [Solirubrobacteraceae bacterium]
MRKIATADPAVSSNHRPGLRLVEPAAPSHIVDEPLLHWTESEDGRYECHEPSFDVVLSPVPTGQAVRLLEVNGSFHILTGKITDDRAMKVLAEDVVAGF